ncbi:hypothetical protein ACHWQZ_G009534 [Mnemiopsis leidyi]
MKLVMTSLLTWQIISIVSLIVGVYLFGFAPLLLGNTFSKAHLSLLSAFSGGVLIGTTFLHLFPEVSESAAKFRCTAGIDSSYPVGELLICVGLIAVMIIENMAAEYEHVAHQIQLQTRMDEEEDESAALFDPHQKPHHGHSHGHSHDGPGHDHVSHFTMSEELGWGAYILVVALSIHSILEGIAIGLADTVEDLITLFLSVIIHEVCLAFALGLKLFADKHTIKQFVVSLSIFVISCPVGIGIGMVVVRHFTDDTLTQVVFVLKALATGTFVQVTFLEIVAPEFAHRYINQLYKMAMLTFGMIFISLVMYSLHEFPHTDFCKELIVTAEGL